MNKKELIKELEILNKEAKEYLDDLFHIRIYDLAQYNITNTLLKELKK